METSSPGALPGVTYPLRVPNVFPAGGSYESLGYAPEGDGQWQTSVERLSSGNDHTSNTDDEYSVHPCLRDNDGSGKVHLNPYRIQGTNYRNQLGVTLPLTAISTRSLLLPRVLMVGTPMKCPDPSSAWKTLMPTLQLPRHWSLPLHFGSQKASTKAGKIQIIT